MVHTGPIEDWYWQYIGTLKYTVLIHLVQLRCTILIADRYTGMIRFSVSSCIARYGQYVSVRQDTGTWTASYRAVPSKPESPHTRTRRCLIAPRRTRRRLVLHRENETMPRFPAGE
ncbi:hypothetical protein BHM03_00009398 [Ensete ventricosum]|nr:hypothetical protein BHM03_00009398 [Ensete ventricosum]